jgi:hypothetical protein
LVKSATVIQWHRNGFRPLAQAIMPSVDRRRVVHSRDFFRAFFLCHSQLGRMAPSFRCRSVSKKRERGEERRPNGEIKSREHRSKNASICRSSNTSVLAKELPNYRFFFLAKIAFQLSL